jgi:hypothetical protein
VVFGISLELSLSHVSIKRRLEELRARGLRVEAIARPGTISGKLYKAVDGCHFLGEPIPISA